MRLISLLRVYWHYPVGLSLLAFAFCVGELSGFGRPMNPLMALKELPVLALSMGGIWLWLLMQPQLQRLATVILALALLGLLLTKYMMGTSVPWWADLHLVWAYASLSSLLLVCAGVASGRMPALPDGHCFNLTLARVFFYTVALLSTPAILAVTAFSSLLIDAFIVAFQNRIGLFGFEAVLVAWYRGWPQVVQTLVSIPYATIILGVTVMQMRLPLSAGRHFFTAWFMTALLGIGVYYMLPAMCMLSLERVYPGLVITGTGPEGITYLYDNSEAHNAIPSLHTAWAMLILLFSVVFSWRWRWLPIAFGVANIMATILMGMHWVTDLMMSPPLVAVSLYLSLRLAGIRAYEKSTLICLLGYIGFIAIVMPAPERLYLYAWPMACYLLALAGFSIHVAVRLARLARA